MLTQNTASRTSTDHNMITVTFDMKGGKEEALAPALRPKNDAVLQGIETREPQKFDIESNTIPQKT
jgi:hypothetical protein